MMGLGRTDTKLVEYLAKCRRFPRGSDGIYFRLSWLLDGIGVTNGVHQEFPKWVYGWNYLVLK